VLALAQSPVFAGDAIPPLAAPITDVWQLGTLGNEPGSLVHPLRIEARVSYVDPQYRLSWLEFRETGVYVALAENAPPLRAGQRVLIEGTYSQSKGLAADMVTVKVLKDFEPIAPVSSSGRIGDIADLGGRIVAVEGYVDRQEKIDGYHTRIYTVVDGRIVTIWLKSATPTLFPDLQGKLIRVQALYACRFDPTATESTIELWTTFPGDFKMLGSLEDSPLFKIPRTPVNQIWKAPLGTMILVRGGVQSFSADGENTGSLAVVRDGTGEVVVHLAQRETIPLGTEVEATGRLAIAGPKWVLRDALYRRVSPDAQPRQHPSDAADTLESVDQIRQLSGEEAAAGRPVRIEGVVIRHLPEDNLFFIQDLTGAIRVSYDPKAAIAPDLDLDYGQVEGVTYNSGSAPAVRLKAFKLLGVMNPPAPKQVTFDQALSGREDDQLVEMRGFFQRFDSKSGSIFMTTPSGEIVGITASTDGPDARPGALIRIHGVCETRELGGERPPGSARSMPLVYTDYSSVIVEDDAPADPYDLPLRPIADLRAIHNAQDMTRVRISGVVLHAVPGREVFVQDRSEAVRLLTHETLPLAPGDRIEAVGVLGGEGVRVVLRDAAYRRIRTGRAPAPMPLPDPAQLMPSFDAHLVSVRGTLINALQFPDHLSLTLEANRTLFEATLDRDLAAGFPAPDRGSGLELTGIYRMEFDDSRQPRNFTLQLRSPGDIVVFQSPPAWTPRKALAAAAILGGCALMALLWIALLRKRVRQQTEQIREQLERQARLEAEVQRAARLESLGVLAGGIAHDFNNLLTIIVGNLGLAMLEDGVMKSAGEWLREIERGTIRARDLTRQLLTFAKGGEPVRSVVDLPEIVQEAAQLALHGSTVRCDFRPAPGLWRVNADKEQAAQVVRNLVLNAAQAMQKGGDLVVSLSNEVVAAGVRGKLRPGRYVRLEIADSGEGISPENLARIFEPYFSTRKTGAGLGLATVYSIIKRHDGHIEVDSPPGRGTTVSVWLPSADVAPEKAPPPQAPARAAAGKANQRVLLMDDEEPIRRLIELLLRRKGFDTVATADGAAAAGEFADALRAGRPFDLLIFDLTVPGGMGGREALDVIRKLDPEVPAIVSSGYSSDPVMANFASYGFQAAVPKPYDVGKLVRVITELLGARTTAEAQSPIVSHEAAK
jgi:signal transduction histidine kinase/FixJ family two-component response regulator